MKQPRRRQRPGHSWDRLNGTRLEVLQLDGVTVRRVCVNVLDPMAAVVSFGVHSLTTGGAGHTLRFVAVDNWNDDARELHAIPEAREWFARLWRDGKPLLRLLSESSADMPPDDRAGLSPRAVSQLGFGWREVWVLGHGNIDARLATGDDGGPVWELEVEAATTLEKLRAELLQMSPENPEGYTHDDATNRRWFMQQNMGRALNAARSVGPSHVVLVLSLADAVAGRLATELAGMTGQAENIAAAIVDARRADLHPGAIVGVPRESAAALLGTFAPEAAARIAAGGPPKPGCVWGVFVAHNGTTLAQLDPEAKS